MSYMIHLAPVLHCLTDCLTFPMTIQYILSLKDIDRWTNKKKISNPLHWCRFV